MILKDLFRAYRYRYKLDKQEIQYLLQTLKKGETAVIIEYDKPKHIYEVRKL